MCGFWVLEFVKLVAQEDKKERCQLSQVPRAKLSQQKNRVGVSEWASCSSSVICSAHFTEDQYQHDPLGFCARRKLAETAVLTRFVRRDENDDELWIVGRGTSSIPSGPPRPASVLYQDSHSPWWMNFADFSVNS